MECHIHVTNLSSITQPDFWNVPEIGLGNQGGLHRGGRGGGRPPNLSIGGASPPQL